MLAFCVFSRTRRHGDRKICGSSFDFLSHLVFRAGFRIRCFIMVSLQTDFCHFIWLLINIMWNNISLIDIEISRKIFIYLLFLFVKYVEESKLACTTSTQDKGTLTTTCPTASEALLYLVVWRF